MFHARDLFLKWANLCIDLRTSVVTYVLAQDHIKSCFLSRVSLISCSKKQLFMVDIVGISLAYEQIKIDIVIDELCFLLSQL